MSNYYRAYDDRYRQVHGQALQWSSDSPTPIVEKTIAELSLPKSAEILEIGCGEGRDAFHLLDGGYKLLGVDISPEAIDYCKRKRPEYSESFKAADCLCGSLGKKFGFIYSVAVLHMLVDDSDRAAFYAFIREHLCDGGIALICTMGDGEAEYQSDPSNAFRICERIHQQTGKPLMIASTSCRVVSFATFEAELKSSGFEIVKSGLTSSEPDFSSLMFAAVRVRS